MDVWSFYTDLLLFTIFSFVPRKKHNTGLEFTEDLKMDSDNVEKLILSILDLDEFDNARYYALHLAKPLWRIFWHVSSTPYFLRNICAKVKISVKRYQVKLGDILAYYVGDKTNGNYLSVAIKIKKIKPQCKLDEMQIISMLMDGMDISEYVDIDEDMLICSLVCYVLDNNRLNILDFNEICKIEEFTYETTDYKLTKVNEIKFLSSGYIYDNKYYLYSIFINREKLEYFDEKPAVFRIIEEEISSPDIYMRLDERLAVPSEDRLLLDTLNSEKFRGIQFQFSKTNLDRGENIIVHGNIESYDKLLMIIKKDYDDPLGEDFWHVELEELPYSKNINRVTVTLMHGKYYPAHKLFRHIDYIKNQYPYDIYIEKYKDMTNSEVPIDYYTDKTNHYKIWCVEETDISEETWYKLVYTSLRPKYKTLLNEILGMN